MPTRLKASLAYPVTTAGSPPLLLETFLDAVTYLHAREQQYACPEAGRMVDRLMLAAASRERSEMQQATRQLEEFLNSRSW